MIPCVGPAAGWNWLLLEVLGDEPVVVAQGHNLRRFVPLTSFLRRTSNITAIRAAVDATIDQKSGLVKTVADGQTIIRTEPILMSDGRMHGVHVWTGPPTVRPRPRSVPGAVVWDVTAGIATDTRQALWVAGLNVDTEKTHGRTFAEDIPMGDINVDEPEVLALAVNTKPDDTFCTTWDLTAYDGTPIRTSFVARTALEPSADGTDHLIARAMNWRVPRDKTAVPNQHLAARILHGMTQDGIHRALVDLKTWNLLKWLDPPCPHVDWRSAGVSRPFIHPDDRPVVRSMTQKFARDPAAGVLRIRGWNDSWATMHVTVYRVKLLDDTYVGLICLRLPTPAGLAATSFDR
jgi:hypothetical protein